MKVIYKLRYPLIYHNQVIIILYLSPQKSYMYVIVALNPS